MHGAPKPTEIVSRRRALVALGLGAATGLLTACAPAAAPSSPTTAAAKPTDAPKPTEPPKPAAPVASPGASPSPSPSPSPAAASAPAAPSVAKPSGAAVKIGVLTPLSPPGDPGSGQLVIRGADLAAEYINQRVGTSWAGACNLPGPVELVKFDDSGTPEKGLAGFRKLVDDDKVIGVTGQIHSSVMLALGPLAEQYKVPVFSSQASATDISAKHLEYTFQPHAITKDRAAAIAEFIKENKDQFKKIAILAENTDYGTGNVDDLKSALAGDSAFTVRDWIFDRTLTDLSPLLLQVKSFDPDLIFNVASTQAEYLMVPQAYEAGLMPKTLQVISDDRPIRPEFWQAVGERGKGVIFVSYYHPNQQLSEAGKWAQSEYQKKHGEPIVYTALQGFGNVLMLAQAVNQACATDGPSLMKALESGKLMNWTSAGVSFPRADGFDWHRLRIPILLLQYTEGPQDYAKAQILSPASMKTGNVFKP